MINIDSIQITTVLEENTWEGNPICNWINVSKIKIQNYRLKRHSLANTLRKLD